MDLLISAAFVEYLHPPLFWTFVSSNEALEQVSRVLRDLSPPEIWCNFMQIKIKSIL